MVSCPWKSVDELDAYFPATLRRVITGKKVNLFTIDVYVVAVSVGLPSSRINQVMQSTFFELLQELAKQGRERQRPAAVDRMYGAKHPKIVTSNKAALHAVPQNLNKVDYPASWLSAVETEVWRRVACQGILNLEERLPSDSQSSRNAVWRMKCQSGFQTRADSRRTELR